MYPHGNSLTRTSCELLVWILYTRISRHPQHYSQHNHCTERFFTVETAFYHHPLEQQKPVLNSRWSVKLGWLRHALAKSPLSSPQIWSGGHFPNSHNTLAAVYTDILSLCCSKFVQKVVPSLHKPTPWYMWTLLWSDTQVHLHVNGSLHAKSGCRWSRSAGSHSPHRLSCTARNFGHKDQALIDHRYWYHKSMQFSLYSNTSLCFSQACLRLVLLLHDFLKQFWHNIQ